MLKQQDPSVTKLILWTLKQNNMKQLSQNKTQVRLQLQSKPSWALPRSSGAPWFSWSGYLRGHCCMVNKVCQNYSFTSREVYGTGGRGGQDVDGTGYWFPHFLTFVKGWSCPRLLAHDRWTWTPRLAGLTEPMGQAPWLAHEQGGRSDPDRREGGMFLRFLGASQSSFEVLTMRQILSRTIF